MDSDELTRMKTKINKYIMKNDYENAFFLLIMYLQKLNLEDKEDMIAYYYDFLNTKASLA
jgi:hypothetical protein